MDMGKNIRIGGVSIEGGNSLTFQFCDTPDIVFDDQAWNTEMAQHVDEVVPYSSTADHHDMIAQ